MPGLHCICWCESNYIHKSLYCCAQNTHRLWRGGVSKLRDKPEYQCPLLCPTTPPTRCSTSTSPPSIPQTTPDPGICSCPREAPAVWSPQRASEWCLWQFLPRTFRLEPALLVLVKPFRPMGRQGRGQQQQQQQRNRRRTAERRDNINYSRIGCALLCFAVMLLACVPPRGGVVCMRAPAISNKGGREARDMQDVKTCPLLLLAAGSQAGVCAW